LGNEEPESPHPIKALHDFLFDVEKELKKFRRMSIIGVMASVFMILVVGRFIFFLFYFSPRLPRGPIFYFDLILIILALAFLFYSIYTLFSQSAFFKKWGKRFQQIQTLEQTLLEEKEEKN